MGQHRPPRPPHDPAPPGDVGDVVPPTGADPDDTGLPDDGTPPGQEEGHRGPERAR